VSRPQLQVEAHGDSRATPDAVWALVGNAATYPEWGPWNAAGYERPGDESERGAGAVQRLRSGRTTSVEQILEVEEGRRLRYTVIRGIPVRDYRAEVTLTPTADGTHITWAATWDRTLMGRLVHRKLRSFFPDMMVHLVAAADRGASGP
jgi:uncharacterized protein YndB with AHSA1/START domain